MENKEVVKLELDGRCIFKAGEWVEITKEKKEIVLNGVTYIEKQINKEL